MIHTDAGHSMARHGRRLIWWSLLLFGCLKPTTLLMSQDTPATSSLQSNLAALRAEAEMEHRKTWTPPRRQAIFELYKEILQHPENTGRGLTEDLAKAMTGFSDEGLYDDFETLMEIAIAAHPNDWQIRMAIAGPLPEWLDEVLGLPIEGHRIGDQYHRDDDPYSSESAIIVSFEARDRVRDLRLLLEAIEILKNDPASTRQQLGDAYEGLADKLRWGSSYRFSQKDFNILTDLQRLPDPEPLYEFDDETESEESGASEESDESDESDELLVLDDRGQPVGLLATSAWQEAKSDWERWNWALERSIEADPDRRGRLELQRIDQLVYLVGIPTSDDLSIADIRALPDSDTYLQAVDGIRRVTLDSEINPFVLLQRIIERNDAFRTEAIAARAQLRISRHQLRAAAEDLAAETQRLNQQIESLTESTDRALLQTLTEKLSVLNTVLGTLRGDSIRVAPTAEVRTNGHLISKRQSIPLELTFRNANSVTFRVLPIDLDQLLNSTASIPRTNKRADQTEHRLARETILKSLLAGMGQLTEAQRDSLETAQLVGPVVKEWTVPLTPLPEHELTTTTLDVPIDVGVSTFLLTVGDGKNVSGSFVCWRAAPRFIFRPRKDAGWLGYLANGETGRGLPNVTIEVYDENWSSPGREPGKQNTLSTNDNGEFELPPGTKSPYLMIGRQNDRIIAVYFLPLGLEFETRGRKVSLESNNGRQQRAFVVTDRPIYRPGDTVQFHFRIQKPFGVLDQNVHLPGVTALIRNQEEQFVAECTHFGSGGFTGEWKIPMDARPDDYELQPKLSTPTGESLTDQDLTGEGLPGSALFRVEEYRRPDFRVKLSQTELNQNADQQEIHVLANYVFGEPVSSGRVQWRLIYQPAQQKLFPTQQWDALYGNGYDWAPETAGGRSPWGSSGPFGQHGLFSIPAESVAVFATELHRDTANTDEATEALSGEAVLNKDGECDIKLSGLKQLSESGLNALEVEVTDLTRRVARATIPLGSISPVTISVKTDRSFCRQGETIQATIGTFDLQGNPVEQECCVEILDLITGDAVDANDSYAPSQTFNVRTNEAGLVTIPLTVTRTGKVKIKVSLRERLDVNHVIDLINVPSQGSPDIPFDDLDLRVEHRENHPGKIANLLISGPTPDATILLFLRPSFGFVDSPQILKLNGHTLTVPVEIKDQDCPYIYAEVMAVSDFGITSKIQQILAPPASQSLEVRLSQQQVGIRPGDNAEISVRIIDSLGQPAAASILLAAYDERLDQLCELQPTNIMKSFYGSNLWHRRPSSETFSVRSQFDHVDRVQMDSHLAINLSQVSGQEFTVHDQTWYYSMEDNHPGLSGGGRSGAGVFGGGGGFGGGVGFGGGGGGVLGGGDGFVGEEQSPSATLVSNERMPGPLDRYADPRLRSAMRDTAFFNARLETDETGELKVRIPLPDNLTTWKVLAWAIDPKTRVGSAQLSLQTSQPIMIRPHVPRHLTAGDAIALSAAVYSSLDTETTCQITLKSANHLIQLPANSVQQVRLKPNVETLVHWSVDVIGSGNAELMFSAQSNAASDAVQLTLPSIARGEYKSSVRFASIKESEPSAELTFEIPANRLPEKSTLELQWGTSVADPILDALPYLIEYPHGCAEQTTNKFVPLALAWRAAEKFPQLQFKNSGSNQESKAAGTRHLPDEASFRRMLSAGRRHLESLQNEDGGWGWFGSEGLSNPDLTAQVVYGLALARNDQQDDSDRSSDESLENGIRCLESLLKARRLALRRENSEPHGDVAIRGDAAMTDTDAAMVFVISQLKATSHLEENSVIDHTCSDLLKAIERDAERISPLGIILAALAAHTLEDTSLRQQFVSRAESFVARDPSTESIRIVTDGRQHGRWYESANEALARYLQLRMRINPEDPELNWIRRGLLSERRSSFGWENTRDTSVAIEALIELLSLRAEEGAQPDFAVFLDDEQIPMDNLPAGEPDRRHYRLIKSDHLTPGLHTLEIRRLGGPGFDAMLVSREFDQTATVMTDQQAPLSIVRRFFKRPIRTGPRSPSTTNDERIPLAEDATIEAGDIIEVELSVTSKESFEYLMLQNPHAAGFEAHQLPDQFPMSTHYELRDDRLDIYIESLHAGTSTYSYQLRTEHPGVMWNNPARVGSMYFNRISASTGTWRFQCE